MAIVYFKLERPAIDCGWFVSNWVSDTGFNSMKVVSTSSASIRLNGGCYFNGFGRSWTVSDDHVGQVSAPN